MHDDSYMFVDMYMYVFLFAGELRYLTVQYCEYYIHNKRYFGFSIELTQ